MRYRFAFAAAFIVATASPVIGQVHPPHDRNRQHGPDHVIPDSATHAAMHALLHGRWDGTMSQRDGAVPLSLSVTSDSAAGFAFALTSDARVRAGLARHVQATAGKVQWDQVVDGRVCKASADLSKTNDDRPTMKGSVKCDKNEFAFTLKRVAH